MVHESTAFITGYRAESRRHGRTLRTKVLALWEEAAPEHVAEALGLRPGDAVTCLIRLRHLEGYNQNAPVVYTIVYVPCALFPDMRGVDFTDASLYEILAERGWRSGTPSGSSRSCRRRRTSRPTCGSARLSRRCSSRRAGGRLR